MSATEISIPIAVLAVAIVFMNTAVIVLIVVNRELRTCTNHFVVSLAASDVLLGATLFVQYAVSVSSPLVLNVMYSIALLSSVANLGAVSLDRYLAVVRPFRYWSTIPRCCTKIIFTSWVLSAVTACIPLAWQGKNNRLALKIYQFSVLLLGILLPYALILVSYWRIYIQVRKCVQRERLLTRSVLTYQKLKLSSEAKIAKVFAIICLTFVLAWLPITWITIAVAIDRFDLIPKEFAIASPFTLAIGSIINPVLYAFMKPDIRNAAVRCLPKRFEHLSVKATKTTGSNKAVKYTVGNSNHTASISVSST